MSVSRSSRPAGRPSAAIAAARRKKAQQALKRDPNMRHEALAELLEVSRPSATLIAAELREADLVPPPSPPSGESPRQRVPRAVVDRLLALTKAPTLTDAIVKACDELESVRRRRA